MNVDANMFHFPYLVLFGGGPLRPNININISLFDTYMSLLGRVERKILFRSSVSFALQPVNPASHCRREIRQIESISCPLNTNHLCFMLFRTDHDVCIYSQLI